MATAAKDMLDGAVVLALSPNDILVGDRLGAFWPDKAAALGKMMAQDGQIVPIIVRKSGPRAAAPWTLVAGHHRLVGAKLEGFAVIDAVELIGSQDDCLKAEAAENAARPTRSPLERAAFVRAIADAAEKRVQDQHGDLSPEQIAIRARWDGMKAKAAGVERADDLNDAEADHSSANLALVYGWAEGTAEALGMSRRAMFRDLALHRALVAPFPTLWRALATHPIIGENASALREIASFAEPARRDIVEALVEAPDLTLAQALEGLGLSKPSAPAATGASKYMNNAESNISRLTVGQQRDWAPAFAAHVKPQALAAMRDAILARIEAEGIDA